MDNYFNSSKLFNDIYHTRINTCGTVCHNRKEMLPNFSPEHLQLKRGDMCVQRTRKSKGCLGRTNEKYSYMSFLICTFHLQREISKTVKLWSLIIKDYTSHMGYLDLSARMPNSYKQENLEMGEGGATSSSICQPHYSQFIHCLQVL
jgi:hypothetical protein